MLGLSTLKTKKHLHTFLSMAGLCKFGFQNFGLMVKPLYEATRSQIQLLLWNGDEKILTIMSRLSPEPLFSLPTLKKPFILYIAEQGTDRLKVLTLKLGEFLTYR